MLTVSRPADDTMTVVSSIGETEFGSVEQSDFGYLQKDREADKPDEALPHLPSHRFRYTVWHELAQIQLTGDQLKAPRVRIGPDEREKTFYKLIDASDRPIHHQLKGREKRNYRDKQENWERLELCNFSYQELNHAYQVQNFKRILNRLTSAVEIQLMDNNLQELSHVSFPKCEILNLSRNWIESLKKLPKTPFVQWLDLSDNLIRSLDGLKILQNAPIKYLDLRRCPVTYFTDNYRYKVFQTLPQLIMLDGVRKHAMDLEMTPETYEKPDSLPCSVM